ncbi:hypothetical protein ABFS82_14G195900 [Erythranthe guttata]|uniref:putative E3 ubiquitin-protein ligase RF298 n=1 Tax=Erythranthe guttata TaxID=4155 RepID=UPI00064D7C34|nr:PREDICTED: putative E3 ubiquitin-protein ligase RF298 [Erythranthe guttata]XP_012836640.1 PREDICTED: putative E3 ubiquitin-protein ligase RF298 [Erythranthe guttata]|eukprot:XP_012836639.1 PREDICTED: putative E3 ubiquitin-protein ligase RF298 [Erythranthe guttata]
MDGNSSEGAPAVVANENGKNKRKYVSQDISAEVQRLSPAEFARHEVLEEIENALKMLKSNMESSEEDQENSSIEKHEDQLADWDDPIACRLEELLTKGLSAIFCSAMKKLVENGHTKETAEWAVLNCSFYHGSKDVVSNIVEGATELLKLKKNFIKTEKYVFEGLPSLVDYTLLEMVHVLLEIRPAWSIVEAMWWLLVNDLNLANACVVLRQEGKSETSATTSESDCDTLDNLKAPAQSSQPERSPALEVAKGKFLMPPPNVVAADEKLGGGRKGMSANSKRDMLRQKAIHFEKNTKGRLSKGAFKAKVSVNKSQPGSSSSSSSSSKSQSTSANKDPVFALPANTKPPPPPYPPKDYPHKPRPPQTATTTTITDYYASMPFDEILHKYIPKDDKDKVVLKLVSHKEALEKEIKGWDDWVKEKLMQATTRLAKDKSELKLLKQEKEELEKFNKEMQTLEEGTAKRLSEMQNALDNTLGQIELANLSVRRLEEENLELKKMMEDARLKALASANDLLEARRREQEILKKLQSCETEKGLLVEELTCLKRKNAEQGEGLGKAKERQNQIKVLLKQGEKEKLKASAELDFLRGKNKELNDRTEMQADSINQTAEKNKQALQAKIENHESMISKLRLESDKLKIAALSVGYGNSLSDQNASALQKIGKRLVVGDGDGNRDRECVLCMSEEISVLFLPCMHLTVCVHCNELLEKDGTKDCPSCRAKIDKRIPVGFFEG